jgi:AmmeMemoRadiSam system protein B
VEENDLTMCGYIPTSLALMVLKELGAHRGVQVGHTHSGVVTGDDRSVVSYAGYWFQ